MEAIMIARFRYFEDYQIGDKGETTPRTVGETDITHFACLTGDYSRIHMDGHYAAGTLYKGRIAHGLLGASLEKPRGEQSRKRISSTLQA